MVGKRLKIMGFPDNKMPTYFYSIIEETLMASTAKYTLLKRDNVLSIRNLYPCSIQNHGGKAGCEGNVTSRVDQLFCLF